jgi:hypothetical protein
MNDTELKKKWVAALRSGEYKQGQRGLRSRVDNEDRFCCLGVLCDLIDSTKWRGVVYAAGEDYEERLSYVPDAIAASIGLSSDDQHELARLNDSGYSFAHIAEVIESKL